MYLSIRLWAACTDERLSGGHVERSAMMGVVTAYCWPGQIQCVESLVYKWYYGYNRCSKKPRERSMEDLIGILPFSCDKFRVGLTFVR